MPTHRLSNNDPLESPKVRHKVALTERPKEQKIFKILVIGEVSVGKTSLIKRYVHNLFSQQYRATIGVDFALKKIIWNDEIDIIAQLWDIAGQDRFASLTRVYYKGSSGSFVITDASSPESFESAIKWKKDFDSKVTLENGQPVPSLLLVNKCDLEKVGIASDRSKLDYFATENGFIGWYYVSAKDNIGIKDAAKHLINRIMAVGNSHQNQEHANDSIDLNNEKHKSNADDVIVKVTNGNADQNHRKKSNRCGC